MTEVYHAVANGGLAFLARNLETGAEGIVITAAIRRPEAPTPTRAPVRRKPRRQGFVCTTCGDVSKNLAGIMEHTWAQHKRVPQGTEREAMVL